MGCCSAKESGGERSEEPREMTPAGTDSEDEEATVAEEGAVIEEGVKESLLEVEGVAGWVVGRKGRGINKKIARRLLVEGDEGETVSVVKEKEVYVTDVTNTLTKKVPIGLGGCADPARLAADLLLPTPATSAAYLNTTTSRLHTVISDSHSCEDDAYLILPPLPTAHHITVHPLSGASYTRTTHLHPSVFIPRYVSNGHPYDTESEDDTVHTVTLRPKVITVKVLRPVEAETKFCFDNPTADCYKTLKSVLGITYPYGLHFKEDNASGRVPVAAGCVVHGAVYYAMEKEKETEITSGDVSRCFGYSTHEDLCRDVAQVFEADFGTFAITKNKHIKLHHPTNAPAAASKLTVAVAVPCMEYTGTAFTTIGCPDTDGMEAFQKLVFHEFLKKERRSGTSSTASKLGSKQLSSYKHALRKDSLKYTLEILEKQVVVKPDQRVVDGEGEGMVVTLHPGLTPAEQRDKVWAQLGLGELCGELGVGEEEVHFSKVLDYYKVADGEVIEIVLPSKKVTTECKGVEGEVVVQPGWSPDLIHTALTKGTPLYALKGLDPADLSYLTFRPDTTVTLLTPKKVTLVVATSTTAHELCIPPTPGNPLLASIKSLWGAPQTPFAVFLDTPAGELPSQDEELEWRMLTEGQKYVVRAK